MPEKPACIKSIVTTELQRRVAASYGCECHDCLTGFKWIAALMARFEKEGLDFVFGTEESYGYLVENEVRDKDGISAAAMTAEATLYWRSKGKSLLDRLTELWIQEGYYEELGISKYFQGSDGMEKMKGIMAGYRAAQPASLGGIAVTRIADLKEGFAWDPASPGKREKLSLPPSNVIQWTLVEGTVVTVRPSGTEPKIKFYASCRGDPSGGLDKGKAEVKAKLAAIEKDIRAVVG
jgi:phosphoglucomutase